MHERNATEYRIQSKLRTYYVIISTHGYYKSYFQKTIK